MDRGDRVSIQGDGHPTMAAALAAFGSTDTYALVHKMLVKTDSGCANQSQCRVVDSSLMPYPLYWASSVNDWYWASGDTANFLALAPDMARIIDNAVDKFLQPNLNVAWFGWDDRVANGFCGSCNLEAQLGFASLTIRACNDFSATLKHAGDTVNASRYAATAVRLSQTLRSRPATTVPGGAWWEDYGVHAAAYMINARTVATPAEEESIFNKVLTNSVTICSWSPFNQYWILQALGCVWLQYPHCVLPNDPILLTVTAILWALGLFLKIGTNREGWTQCPPPPPTLQKLGEDGLRDGVNPTVLGPDAQPRKGVLLGALLARVDPFHGVRRQGSDPTIVLPSMGRWSDAMAHSRPWWNRAHRPGLLRIRRVAAPLSFDPNRHSDAPDPARPYHGPGVPRRRSSDGGGDSGHTRLCRAAAAG